jgi:hypothetical protein
MPDKIIFKEENENDFWKYWKEYVEKNNISPKYLRTYIEPLLIISKENGLLCSDRSFVYLENNEVVACAFLPIEKENKDSTTKSIKIECDGDFVLSPLCKNKNIEKKVFNLIDDVAKQNGLSKIMFYIDPLERECYSFNYLQKYNYLTSSILVYFIDTRKEKDLLALCREGCRKLIRPLLKNNDFSVFYIDKENPDLNMHKLYENLHHKCAGRVTRPQWTFDNQFEELKQGHAVLFGLKYKGKEVAFCYFSYNANKAIYSSGADDPDYDKMSLYHILIFSAMKYFQEKGIDFIDVGQPSCPSSQFFYYPDEKQLKISLFKRGFCGEYAEDFRGIKYFSKDVFEKDMQFFTKNYIVTSNL